MAGTKRPFLLYEDTFEFIYSRLVTATLDPLVTFRVIEVHPRKMRYLCEVTSRGSTWWQWIYLHHNNGRKMYEKPKVKRKKDPTLV